MPSDREILKVIKHVIDKDEKIGYNTGGSGHSAYKSYKIENFKTQWISDIKCEIHYSYTVYVETEFTYYPDNPPERYQRSRIITINSDGKVIEASKSNE